MNNYEIHITLQVPPYKDAVHNLRALAMDMGVKLILIDANPLTDVMTSWRTQSDDQNAVFQEMTRQMITLAGRGVTALRAKVETDLDHPAAATPLPNQYFESHFQVLVTNDQLADLKDLACGLDLYVSRNAFKPPVDGRHIRMVTAREYHTTREKFRQRMEAIAKVLPVQGFELAKGLEIEFALYDSNARHDDPWIHSRGF